MPTLYTNEMIEIIKNEYPDSDNEILSNKLGISQNSLRWKASQLGIRKSDVFMKEYYLRLQENKKIKRQQNYKNYEMNNIEKNIIIGSLLGDGTLSKYGRSLNACYRENTGLSQIEYRKWKAKRLANLDFKMDDGSLVINNYKKSNSITLFPQVLLYSQSFTLEENILLMEYLNKTFNVEFKLSKRKDGSNYILKINKRNEVYKFLEIVKPYVNEIPNMIYKVDVESKLIDTYKKYADKYKDKIIKIASNKAFDNTYSDEEESRIIEMINDGVSYKDIAQSLDRTYYGLYNKVRRMKENELI